MPWVKRYHLYDGQCSTSELIDENETVTDTFRYDAWGNDVDRVGTTKTPFRWNGRVGYFYDEEIQAYQVRQRPYGPRDGQFPTPDPIWPEDYLNPYSYVGNNPVNTNDPSGLGRWSDAAIAIWTALGYVVQGSEFPAAALAAPDGAKI